MDVVMQIIPGDDNYDEITIARTTYPNRSELKEIVIGNGNETVYIPLDKVDLLIEALKKEKNDNQ
jgi:hypothetical protein